MIPTILTGGNQESRAAEINTRYPSAKYVLTHIQAEKSSILIAQIHALLKDLSVTANLPRLIWIEEAGKLTTPAQNALLKVLEEPPEKTVFILSVANPKNLLATICSRCQIIKVREAASLKLDGLALAEIKRALPLTAGNRILAADALGRKREPLLLWTQNCLSELEQKIGAEKSARSLAILTNIAGLVHTAYTDLQANISVTLAMQNLFLKLPHIRA